MRLRRAEGGGFPVDNGGMMQAEAIVAGVGLRLRLRQGIGIGVELAILLVALELKSEAGACCLRL